MEQWVADLENQIVEAEIALSAPEVTVKDLQSILNGPYPTTIEEFKSMISQRHIFKPPVSPPNLIGWYSQSLYLIRWERHLVGINLKTYQSENQSSDESPTNVDEETLEKFIESQVFTVRRFPDYKINEFSEYRTKASVNSW